MKISLLFTAIMYFSFCSAQVHPNVPWTWMNGDSTENTPGSYGIRIVASPANRVGARTLGMTWTDASGNLWLFGGWGYKANGSGWFNDLWKYNPNSDVWTWMHGDTIVNQTGVYGIKGVASPLNKPGARERAVSWTDNAGNFWLFGGTEYAGPYADYNDLWKYIVSSNEWVWVSGDSVRDANSSYGTLGVEGSGDGPGARAFCSKWVDAANNLWLYGGFSTNEGELSDFWKFNPVVNKWTWVNGDSIPYVNPSYGIQGVPNINNKPGSSFTGADWIDLNGKFWLFGGSGNLNNLWKYDPATNEWTWMRGNLIANSKGTYGMLGVEAPTNIPGTRGLAATWTDNLGNLFMFGGSGYATQNYSGLLNDLWKYNVQSNIWTWVKGDSTVDKRGHYGTKKVAAAMNSIPSKTGSMFWKTQTGNVWIFGGTTYVVGAYVWKNDLWKIISPISYAFNGDGDWLNPSNWVNNLVPSTTITENMFVSIKPGGVCNRFGDIYLEQFGTLTVEAGKRLNMINGNLNNNGYLLGPGKIMFSGGLTALNSTGFISTPLILSNKQLFLTNSVNTASIELTNNSNISIDNFDLNMDTANLVADSNNFIITDGTGKLRRFVSGVPKVFSIGVNSTSYTPATLSNSGIPGPYSIRVAPNILNRPGRDSVKIGAVNRTWVIADSIPGSIDLTFQWKISDEQPGFDRSRASIARVCPPPYGCENNFDVAVSGPATGNNPYTISRSSITALSSLDTFIVRSNPVKFTFTGSGNWTSTTNWTDNLVPAVPIKAGFEVIIDPLLGECVFTGNLIIESGGILKVQPGKILNVSGNLIQQ